MQSCIVCTNSSPRRLPRCQVHDLKEPAATCDTLLDLAVRLARCGLIHGDLNEFNVMVDKEDRLTLIDFPQMVSTSHSDAEWRVFFLPVHGRNGAP